MNTARFTLMGVRERSETEESKDMLRLSTLVGAQAATVLLISMSVRAAADPPAVDPVAMAALQKMGVYLRSLTTFQVAAAITDEDVLDDGQKIQHSSTTTLLARKPDRLRAEVSNDDVQRLFFYDGKNFTLFGERLGYYATVPAPPTISQLADKLDASYDSSVPLEDLFRWGASGWDAGSIKGAMDVGASSVGGVTCEQYAIRQDDIDWQIWLQRGEYPLPLKIVITSRTDEARPQHTAVFTWNLAPSFNDSAFKFEPPPGSQRVVLPGSASTATKPVAGNTNAPKSTK